MAAICHLKSKGKGDIEDKGNDQDKEYMTKEQLRKMTKAKLFDLLASHNKTVTNKSRCLKDRLIEIIVEGKFNWRAADDKGSDKGNDKDEGKGNDSGDKGKGDDNSGDEPPDDDDDEPPDDDGDEPPDDDDDDEPPDDEGMQIFARLPDGNTITMDVETSHTIYTLKAIIKNKEGIPMKHQRLIFNDNQLEDGYTLEDYDIQNESMLILMTNLHGGMPRKGNVIKSIVKSKTFDRTVSDDQVKFFTAFTKAEASTRLTSIDFKNLLEGCTIDTLERMHKYMKHDKSKSSTKIEKLCEMTSDIQEYYIILCDTIVLRYNFAWPS